MFSRLINLNLTYKHVRENLPYLNYNLEKNIYPNERCWELKSENIFVDKFKTF